MDVAAARGRQTLESAAARHLTAGGAGVVGHRGGAHAAARDGDGVDLLDEADRPALLPGGLAQRLEVGADLAGRRAVVHRLERRRRHEEERHPGLASHGLGDVGLAGARSAFEEQSAPGAAAHLVGERLVGQEEVERPDHVLLDRVDALDVVEGHVDLLGPVGHVRRAARHDRGADEHDDEGDEEDHRRELERVDRRHVEVEHVQRLAVGDAPEQVGQRQRQQDGHPPEPTPAHALAGAGHIGTAPRDP
jgi:hypothetical protein